jgi:hypothetical protein
MKWVGEFYDCKENSDGKKGSCKECYIKQQQIYRQIPEVKIRQKEYHKEHYQIPEVKARMSARYKERSQIPEVKTQKNEYDKQHSQVPEVKARKKDCNSRHRQIPEVKAQKKAYNKGYNQQPEVKAKQRKRHKERMGNDPNYRLMKNCRRRLNHALKAIGVIKSQRTKELLSAPIELVWVHLEKQFRFPMTRENYGKVWHVDHIRPICSFDLTDPEQLKACFHYTNLQPLFVEENLKKGGRY